MDDKKKTRTSSLNILLDELHARYVEVPREVQLDPLSGWRHKYPYALCVGGRHPWVIGGRDLGLLLSPDSDPHPPAATKADLSEGQPEARATLTVVIGHELKRCISSWSAFDSLNTDVPAYSDTS